jgi:probable F420-dependent oxidoreductase
MPWPESPVGKLRELIGAIRAFWQAWQSGERLNFRGEHFKLTLMSPFFNPGPIEHPEIPIYLAGVNPGLCRLAGELADGFHAHPYHSTRYLSEVVRPALAAGIARAGRPEGAVTLSTTAFAATDPREAEFVRRQIAFYASTPTYRPVMELHGWGEVADRLQGMARRGEWAALGGPISPEMLEAFAVVCEPDQLGAALRARYQGLVDRLSLYLPYVAGERETMWQGLVRSFREGAGP